MPVELYTPSQVLSIVGSIGVLITAVGAVIVNIIIALKTGKKMDAVSQQANQISNQVQEVHTLTNSNLSAVKVELAAAVGQMSQLREQVAELKNERDKLATITAIKSQPRDPTMRGRSTDVETLKSIDANTKITAENTTVLHDVPIPVVVKPDAKKGK